MVTATGYLYLLGNKQMGLNLAATRHFCLYFIERAVSLNTLKPLCSEPACNKDMTAFNGSITVFPRNKIRQLSLKAVPKLDHDFNVI